MYILLTNTNEQMTPTANTARREKILAIRFFYAWNILTTERTYFTGMNVMSALLNYNRSHTHYFTARINLQNLQISSEVFVGDWPFMPHANLLL